MPHVNSPAVETTGLVKTFGHNRALDGRGLRHADHALIQPQMTDVERLADDWPARLRAATEASARRRASRVAARRESTARRAAGMAARHAWRQARLDARAADRDRRPPW
jgi:hypothetical protein